VLKIASRAVKSNTQYWVRLKVTGTNPGRDPVEGVGGRENRAQKVGGSVSDSDPQRRIERPGAFGFFFAGFYPVVRVQPTFTRIAPMSISWWTLFDRSPA